MKIDCIIFSHTGHTQTVAENLVSALQVQGHTVRLLKLEPAESLNLSAERIALERLPDCSEADLVVLGSPVHGGRVSAPMRTYIEETPHLTGKKVIILLSHFLRKAWGALQARQSMQNLCEQKGARVVGHADVKWFSLKRKAQIADTVDTLTTLIQNQAQ